ncbi:hypothetical protein FOXG_19518 [Fusarium oxysporum f. sp. lycopersici 4287]|uniref:Clr5 domain-containing protein n=1 Tax=Fusarium oxysporum f. sp. lycopersici (strain 4287 / CBS 123668 / FGSC 9935 / NRRL 34936) TaxID=426428 RepID=A0A0J9V2D9_FUSO4|nr:hypothetical protein FOXG_19518 [Fusarium oxysporum f. sp. lycopersici 4287]KNB05308.1 hypothetical protein FOXG_19518 [Fusarium oxysporum f. sp. lycopersici 4287]
MPQTLKIPPARWKAQRGRITELYVNQDKTLDEVIQIMAKSGFHATIGGKVISEKKRKKGLRRYRASQIEEDCKRNVPEYRNLLIHRVHEVVGTSTCGVVALTPPSSNSMVVLINGLPWLNFRESFNDLIKSRPPLFSPNQQNG